MIFRQILGEGKRLEDIVKEFYIIVRYEVVKRERDSGESGDNNTGNVSE